MTRHLVLAGLLVSLAACGMSRSKQAYAADANRLLDTRSAALARCYNAALATNATASGTVTIQFVVEPETGVIKQATVDPTHTTAPEVLDICVLKAVEGLVLAPPDRNEGHATFVYQFTANPVPAAPAA